MISKSILDKKKLLSYQASFIEMSETTKIKDTKYIIPFILFDRCRFVGERFTCHHPPEHNIPNCHYIYIHYYYITFPAVIYMYHKINKA